MTCNRKYTVGPYLHFFLLMFYWWQYHCIPRSMWIFFAFKLEVIRFFYWISKFQSNSDITLFLVGGISLIVSLCWPFLCCYFATLTSDRIFLISHIVYGSKWYLYPLKLQKYITLVIARSQQDAQFTGFNLIGCSLFTFGNVRLEYLKVHRFLTFLKHLIFFLFLAMPFVFFLLRCF